MVACVEEFGRLTEIQLNEILDRAFEGVIGRGCCHNDYDSNEGQNPNWDTTLDVLLNSFRPEERNYLLRGIEKALAEKEIFRIMDQGCGLANSVRDISLRFARKFPTTKVEGYGLSGDMESMRLGRRPSKYSLMNFEKCSREEAIRLIQEHDIHSFEPQVYESVPNVRFFGMQKDIHKTMKDFLFSLDLIFSDHAYFHFMAPWLALKRTADRLSVGGVALVRCLLEENPVRDSSQSDRIALVQSLRRINPDYRVLHSAPQRDYRLVLGVVKKGDVPFKTNMYLTARKLEENYFLDTLYSETSLVEGALAIDSL